MLYSPHRVCQNSKCPDPRLLRHKDVPIRVSVFTRNDGVCDAHSVHLYCYCKPPTALPAFPIMLISLC